MFLATLDSELLVFALVVVLTGFPTAGLVVLFFSAGSSSLSKPESANNPSFNDSFWCFSWLKDTAPVDGLVIDL